MVNDARFDERGRSLSEMMSSDMLDTVMWLTSGCDRYLPG